VLNVVLKRVIAKEPRPSFSGYLVCFYSMQAGKTSNVNSA